MQTIKPVTAYEQSFFIECGLMLFIELRFGWCSMLLNNQLQGFFFFPGRKGDEVYAWFFYFIAVPVITIVPEYCMFYDLSGHIRNADIYIYVVFKIYP